MKRGVWILITMWLFVGGSCKIKPAWERNPRLKLFLADTTYQNYFLSPIWHPSGDKIYFLSLYIWGENPHLLVIDTGKTQVDTLVYYVELFTISHSGNEISYVPSSSTNNAKIIRIDAFTGAMIDSVDVTKKYIYDMEYTHNDSSIIFSGYDKSSSPTGAGFYILNLYTKAESLLIDLGDSLYQWTFTLYPENDSIIYLTSDGKRLWYPDINPVNSSEILKVKNVFNIDIYGINEDEEIFLIDLNYPREAPLNAKPYLETEIGEVTWSPNGKKFVFSAGMYIMRGEWGSIARFELWIFNFE